MNLQEAIDAEDVDTKISIAARHEAGHAVIAAVKQIPLRTEGIMVGQDGQGLSCHCKQPTKTDKSIEASVITSYAGFLAENHFRRLQGLREHDIHFLRECPDWIEARAFASDFSDAYLAGRSLGRVQSDLEVKAQQDVAANWSRIDALAQALLAREWEATKPLKSGGRWTEADTAKYLVCDEIVKLLALFGISATCVENC
jgi:hypothetical protein